MEYNRDPCRGRLERGLVANLVKRHMYQKWPLTVGQPLYCRGTWLSSNVTINLSALVSHHSVNIEQISDISTVNAVPCYNRG